MSRFYFHLIDDVDTLDEEGLEFSDRNAAERHAIRCARELMSDQIRKGRISLDHKIIVEDEQRQTVLELPFREAVAIEAA